MKSFDDEALRVFFPHFSKAMQGFAAGDDHVHWPQLERAFRADMRALVDMMDQEGGVYAWENSEWGYETIMSIGFAKAICAVLPVATDLFSQVLKASEIQRARRRILGSRILARMVSLDIQDATGRERFKRAYKAKTRKRFYLGNDPWWTGWIRGCSIYSPSREEIECLAEALECKPEDLCPWLKAEESPAENS